MRARNNRPIRHPRLPRKRRPWRWIDGNSAGVTTDTGNLGLGPLFAASSGGTSGYRELVVGDFDTEWADESEVLVERVVGQISVRAGLAKGGGYSPAQFTSLLPVVRLGLLVLEDADETIVPSLPSLFERDDLQDAEWMWLFQLGDWNGFSYLDQGAGGDAGLLLMSQDVQLDCTVKRKLGRRDRLVLCHNWAMPNALTIPFDELVTDVQPLLRVGVSTK